jgi:hypothetical protein
VIDPGVTGSSADCQRFLDAVGKFSSLLAIKLYRITLSTPMAVPTLPCLDHEAKLHEEAAPHVAAYIEDESGDLHEVVYVPDERRIDVDAVSTMGERSQASHDRLVTALTSRFPGYAVRMVGPSWIRGDLRVAKACRAQVALRDVLLGTDLDRTSVAVERLQTISVLMEKQSRVTSWGARTVMTPLLALAGFVSYQTLATLRFSTSLEWMASLRYIVVGLLGGYFLYYGLKAVQLTEMANRVWKRSAEYALILDERRRLIGERGGLGRTRTTPAVNKATMGS